MNKKKVFVLIAVLLVALVSTSSITYASQEGNAKIPGRSWLLGGESTECRD